jgi:hypothetical protein
MSDLIGLLVTDHFVAGFRAGLIALGLGWLIVLVLRGREKPIPLVGILIAGSTVAALYALGEAMTPELVGLGLILGGVLLARVLKAPGAIAAVAAIPGAVWLGVATTATELTWVRVAIVILVPLGGYLISDFEQRYEGVGLGAVFFALAALGVFVSVPDTEWPRALIATSVPLTLLAWPRVAMGFGREGGYLGVAVLMLAAANGGGPRPASIVGSFACLGLLLLEPVAIVINPALLKITTWFKHDWAGAIIASIPQFIVVALCSRVAARFTNEIPALAVVALVYVATYAVASSAVTRRSAERRLA